MTIAYEVSSAGDLNSSAYIESTIIEHDAHRIVDVGGGANPLLPLPFVTAHGLTYTILDISADELQKAPRGYETLQADIASPQATFDAQHDLVITKMLAEHIRDAGAFHRNVFRLLCPGGHAIHLFPTLFAPPFVVNRLIPERAAHAVLTGLSGRERVRDGRLRKFPAYYSWCRGPSRRQIERFERIGFEVERYVGYFGTSEYFTKTPRIARIDHTVARWLTDHPVAALTSYARVTLRKPLDAPASLTSRAGEASAADRLATNA